MSSLFMWVRARYKTRKTWRLWAYWRLCVRSNMRTLDVVGNTYCSEKLVRGSKHQVTYLSVIYILLGITTIVGNSDFDPNRPSQKHFASSTFQSIASESGCKWSLHWFCATCLRCFGDLHSARLVANLSPSLFRQWYDSQHFDNSIIVDHNRHKHRQTFGSVVKTQVQTSCHN